MRHQNSVSCQQSFSVCYSACPFVRWSCFMEANAPGDATQAVAQPKSGEFKRHRCTVDEKWWLYQLTRRESDLSLSAYICKSNAQYPNPLSSSTASDWMQRGSIDQFKKLYALNVGKRVRDMYVHSCPVECEKLETALFHWFQGQEAMDLRLKQCLRLLFMCPLLFLLRVRHWCNLAVVKRK